MLQVASLHTIFTTPVRLIICLVLLINTLWAVYNIDATIRYNKTVNDNLLAFLSLVVLDAVVAPDMLLLDRAQLVGFQPPADPEQVPHLSALLDAAAPTHYRLGAPTSSTSSTTASASAEGVCFRRVVWGGGVKVIYHHLLGAVRRLAAQVLRALVMQALQPPSPYALAKEKAHPTHTPPHDDAVGATEKRRALESVDPSIDKEEDVAEFVTEKEKTTTTELVQEQLQRRELLFSKKQAAPTKKKKGATDPASSLLRKGGMFLRGQHAKEVSAASASATDAASTIAAAASASASASARITTLTVPWTTAGSSPSSPLPPQRRPMNVVIYSRGSTGLGRSIPGEAALRGHLAGLGARAVICCDFNNVSLAQQLGYAVHADAIIGLHGAGLINNVIAPAGAITVELKTIYGYGLTLFAVSSEAAQGYFVELDIRDYHVWGKQPGMSRNREIDAPLMTRITDALFAVLRHRESERESEREQRRAAAGGIAAGQGGETPMEKTTSADAKEHAAATAAEEGMNSRLEALVSTPFRQDLFHTLPLSGVKGDVWISPYPLQAVEQAVRDVARHSSYPSSSFSSFSSSSRNNSQHQQLSTPMSAAKKEALSSMDFLLHLLGPRSEPADAVAAQCAAMPLSSYWLVAEEKNLERFCATCTVTVPSASASASASAGLHQQKPQQKQPVGAVSSGKGGTRGLHRQALPDPSARGGGSSGGGSVGGADGIRSTEAPGQLTHQQQQRVNHVRPKRPVAEQGSRGGGGGGQSALASQSPPLPAPRAVSPSSALAVLDAPLGPKGGSVIRASAAHREPDYRGCILCRDKSKD
jgi:hypothetical protein